MDELVNLVSQRTGLSQDQAKTAVDTVVGFIKQRLPAPIAGQIDQVVQTGQSQNAQNVAKDLGGMLGKKSA